MVLTRRDLLKASAAIMTARGLHAHAAVRLRGALETGPRPPVIWLQGAGCNGDTVSLLNSIENMPIDRLLTSGMDLRFHPTLMAAAGDKAVSAATESLRSGGHILVIEGAIPTAANGRHCMLWKEMSMLRAVRVFSTGASFIVAVGTCAAYGGVSAGKPNPTQAKGVGNVLKGDKRIINVPGCPAHPDWVVGTLAYLLKNRQTPPLDSERRPKEYFGKTVHSQCPRRRKGWRRRSESQARCLQHAGCCGEEAHADCPARRFNSPAKGQPGVNWCVDANSPCIACVEPDFPDAMSPFYSNR